MQFFMELPGKGVTSKSSALSHLQFMGSGTILGGNSLTVDAGMLANNMYIIFLRQLKGSTDVHPPCALLLYMRTENYRYTTLGEIIDLDNTSISGGVFTINFTSAQWASAWIFKIS